MNEMTEVRALRGDCPLPDKERLASQRARLVRAGQSGTGIAGRKTAPWAALTGALPRRRVLLLTAAAAAVAVTGGIVATLPGDATAGGPRVLSARASAEALELAAATVESKGATEPGPKQWVYEKSTNFADGKPQTTESWQRWDGTGGALLPGLPWHGDPKSFDPNKLQVRYWSKEEVKKTAKSDSDYRSQPQLYRFLTTLPGDPGAMMRRIRQEHAIGTIKGETRAQRDWRELDVLYRSILIPPKAQAGMFRALAKVSGARVEKGVKDPIGREAIGVFVNYTERTAAGWQGKQEIFFDPKTFAYLGEKRDVGQTPGSPTYKGEQLPLAENKRVEQKPVIVSARAAWGVVDKPGERP
ncbi:CU044_5270 family protein [Streptomyces sp. NPDC002785]|uniref:CU044_5270 family protein n=1 Tax=Streptomyces sp. NPDC002785 TaxID=3154543 RepID=UPI0033322AE2